jgi:hypothetical protein|tara:strand:+ start:182 stop:559 length:378 start_codon:yes stop_codon:yes gene_type:complete
MASKTQKTETPAPAVRATDLTACKIVVKDPKASAALVDRHSRARTARNQRWHILVSMDGKTIADYYKAAREAGVPVSANNPIRAASLGIIGLVTASGDDWTKANTAAVLKHAPAAVRKQLAASAK